MPKDIDSSLVTVGQPTEGGCVYINFNPNAAAVTSAVSELPEGWESLGDVDENGFTLSNSVTSTKHKNWRGQVILTSVTEEANTCKVAFVEVNRPSVAKLRYGPDNVTVGADGEVTAINAGISYKGSVALVVDELESNGFKRRNYMPKVKVEGLDDEGHKLSELIKSGFTFSLLKKDSATSPYYIYRAKPIAAGPGNDEGGEGDETP